jgi:nicotinate-nucleotide--dimethylbenzimidazole phosphoribosyltransferase
MSASGLPFDDIRALAALLPEADADAVAAVRARDATLTKPPGALGRLEEIVRFMAAWQGTSKPVVTRPMVAIFAGNHGVVQQGVSPFPPEVTRQMLENFAAGGAAINQICATFDIGLKIFELALELPTEDITQDAAMDERAAAATIAFGMEAIAGGSDLLCLGEMGIGNTTIAAAIYHALYGGKASDWVGRGTGVDDAGLARKISAVERAVALHAAHLSDPLEILRRLGGREIAAMMGAILAARLQKVPVILDGYVVTAAAALLHAMNPAALDHCLAGHISAEGAHGEVLRRLGLKPILDLEMRLGEASGAALAVCVVKAAVACHNGMATFDQAKVSITRSAGMTTITSVPSRIFERRWNCPPCRSTNPLTMGRPRPVPCSAVLIACVPRPKDSWTISISSAGIPGPVSLIETY